MSKSHCILYCTRTPLLSNTLSVSFVGDFGQQWLPVCVCMRTVFTVPFRMCTVHTHTQWYVHSHSIRCQNEMRKRDLYSSAVQYAYTCSRDTFHARKKVDYFRARSPNKKNGMALLLLAFCNFPSIASAG